jgi:outer membrane lipoprotein-sorting protein
MKKSIALLLLFVSTGYSTSFAQLTPKGDVPTLEEMTVIFNKMMAAIKSVKTAKFRMVKIERYDGKIIKSDQLVKQNTKPLKIYMKITEGPNSGAEVLYVDGVNNGNAYVNASSFLPTLNLDPRGALVSEKQRHTMFELGFAYTGDLINDAYNRYKDKAAEYSTYGGIIKWDNRDVYKITLDNKEYKIKDYTVLAGEDVVKIARKLKLDEYNIKELNPSISSYTSVKAGQVIKIPETFTKTVVMYVDTKTFLPVYQKMTDLKGMVGEYEYHDVMINTGVTDEEFTKGYKGYSF